MKKKLKEIFKEKVLENRLNEVLTNKFFIEEFNIIKDMNNGIDYYIKIINDIQLDRSNKNNSYIMWIYDKVDSLDKNSPCKTISSKISLPDIDTDFEIGKRESVIQYIRDRYGADRVCQVTTFGSLKGKGALKETLRVHQACDETTMNKMSKLFPDEAKIQDELEEQKETSIIRWTLRNRPDVVAEYCQMDEEENLTGEYAKYFEQAIRLEGTYKSYGKHASALCIGYKPIKEICPLIDEKSGDNMIAAIEYEFLEEMGVPKLDILGLASLDKLTSINKLLKMPYIEEEYNE